MSMLRFLFCIRDEHETLVATLDMWKFRVVTLNPFYLLLFKCMLLMVEARVLGSSVAKEEC